MDRNTFVIVLLGVFTRDGKGRHGTTEFISKVAKLGYEIAYLDDLVVNHTKYQYVVSNHKMGGTSLHPGSWYQAIWRKAKNTVKQPLNILYRFVGVSKRYYFYRLDPVQYTPLQAGIKQIRFMYGADISDAWSLDAWNEIYDLFLCHGPNDAMQLKKRFKGKTAIMGYPRYDGYFSPDLKINDVIAEFAIDRTKQTILWMPTWDVFGDNACSIIPFAKPISGLMDTFNIVVRPHPVSLRKDIEAIEFLESLKYNIDRAPTRDMNKLFKVADFVFCDHGGSAFGALYLEKKLVLLRTPAYSDSLMAKGSSNLDLMQYFPSVPVDAVNSLHVLLNNVQYWQGVIESSRSLRDKYFAGYRGTSSVKAAEILSHLITK